MLRLMTAFYPHVVDVYPRFWLGQIPRHHPRGDRRAQVLGASTQRLCERLTLRRDRDEVDGVRGEDGRVLGDPPAQDDDVYAVTLGDRGHTRRCLAPQGLAVADLVLTG